MVGATATGRPNKGRRLLIAAVAVVVAALVAAGTTYALVRDDGDTVTAGRDAANSAEPGATDKATDEEADPGRSSSAPSATTTSSPTDAASQPPASPAGATCWDGTSADEVAACSEPTGLKGLKWVYPQAGMQGCRQAAQGDRILHWVCTVTAASGGTVDVRYSQWHTWTAARDHYNNLEVQSKYQTPKGMTHFYIAARGDGPSYKVAVLYPSPHPWSVTIYGWSAADRDDALANLRTRPVEDLRGVAR